MFPRRVREDHLSIFGWDAFKRLPHDARGFIILVHEGVIPAANFGVDEGLADSVVALLRLIRISCVKGANDEAHGEGVPFFIARGWFKARRLKKLDEKFGKGELEDPLFYDAGRLYGIPTCCVRSFIQGGKDRRPRSGAGSHRGGFSYLYYTPCGEGCAESRELERKIGVVLGALDPEAAAKWREDPPVEKIFA